MAYRIVALLGPAGGLGYYIQKRVKLLFFHIWIPIIKFKLPFPRKLIFQSKNDAKEFIS
jgi:hypothetical protein